MAEHLLYTRVEQVIIRTSFLLFQEFGVKELTSNTDNFYFDDIEINGNVIIDNDPPQVSNSFVKGTNTIEIQFDEPVTTSAEQISNYNLNFNNYIFGNT